MGVKKRKFEMLRLFGIPLMFILLGLGVIGYTSDLLNKQKTKYETWYEINADIVEKGNKINTGYDFNVELTEETIKNNTYHIRYKNGQNKSVDCLYDCKVQTINVGDTATFLINPMDAHDLWLVQPKYVFIFGNTIGGILILIGFLSCSTGLKSLSKEMGD